jgi:hypothetical protein
MKKTCFIKLMMILIIMFPWMIHAEPLVKPAQTQAINPAPPPQAEVENPRFDFGSTIEGTVILHEFIMENKGDGPLIIEDVKTSCGCTAASFTKQISPKQKGSISIKGNTSGYGNRTFSKTISVKTNDPNHGKFILQINGYVESFASVEPNRAILKGVMGEALQTVIAITPSDKFPFKISESGMDPSLKEKISLALKEKGEKYLLTVSNISTRPGNYHGRIYLKTDNEAKPMIIIPVFGSIAENAKP